MNQNKKFLSEIQKIRINLENEKLSISNSKIKELVKESINFDNDDLRASKNIIQETPNSYQKQTLKIPLDQKALAVQASPKSKTDYSSLSPTLGDFLENVNKT